MKRTSKWVLGGGLLALALVGCGGGGGGSSTPGSQPNAGSGGTGGSNASGGAGGSGASQTPAPLASQFTRKATWRVTLPAEGASVCYDFDAAADVADCSGTAWDIKLTPNQRGTTMATNSGTGGPGMAGVYAGAGIELLPWAELQGWLSGAHDPKTGEILQRQIYFPDSSSGAFGGSNEIGSSAFEYGLGGENDHRLYPTYRTYLITTDSGSTNAVGTAESPVFALQLISYYGGASGTVSGHPKFRWIDRREPGNVREASVDASKGWVYFNLITGTETAENGTWHIAFNRYRAQLNGGRAGTGKVAGVVGLTPAGLFVEGEPHTPNAEALMKATPEAYLADLTAASLPETARMWLTDGPSSRLMPPSKRAADGSFDFGWYRYYPTAELAAAAGLPATAHTLGAVADKGVMMRSAEGNSYARVHLAKIEYADPANARSPQTWTFEFEVQPASK
ncbi:MAG: HmuY family protein [Lautropia sp.]|nr:HmuY family protein [Lautropia sp.]